MHFILAILHKFVQFSFVHIYFLHFSPHILCEFVLGKDHAALWFTLSTMLASRFGLQAAIVVGGCGFIQLLLFLHREKCEKIVYNKKYPHICKLALNGLVAYFSGALRNGNCGAAVACQATRPDCGAWPAASRRRRRSNSNKSLSQVCSAWTLSKKTQAK